MTEHSKTIPGILGNKFAGKLVILFLLKNRLIFIVITTYHLYKTNIFVHIFLHACDDTVWWNLMKVFNGLSHFVDFHTHKNIKINKHLKKSFIKAFKLNCFQLLRKNAPDQFMLNLEPVALSHTHQLEGNYFKYCFWIK